MTHVAVPLLTAAERADARRLIESQGLAFDDGWDDLVGLYDGSRLVAAAARAGYVLGMFAIEEACQGTEVLGALTTTLTAIGRNAGQDTFFVFTRAEDVPAFEACQFRLLVDGGAVALVECGPGLDAYLDAHRDVIRPGLNAAVVVNGNPFTRGHQHLVEKAADHVDRLYVFVVREDRSVFPFETRCRLAAESTAHLANVVVLDTSRYAIGAGTFPPWFFGQHDDKTRLQMELDLRLFATRLAPVFDIGERSIGDEASSETTAEYNRVMTEVLPLFGIGIAQIRCIGDEHGIFSATAVREALARGDVETVERLVPPATLAYLRSEEGASIARRLAAARAVAP